MTELDELKATVEEAEKIGVQIVPLLAAAAPEVAALVLCDLLAAWILQRSAHDPARAAGVFHIVMMHIEKALSQELERGPSRPN